MKAPLKSNSLKAILACFVLLLVISCSKSGTTPDPDPVYIKPVAVIKPAENVTMTTATIVAKVVANDSETTVTLESKEVGTSWGVVLTLNIPAGKDSAIISAGLLSLKKGTVYSFRIRATNKGGEADISESKFETYAVSDFDGNLYHTVTIGTQTWLKENFKGTHYANGDAIANVIDLNSWINLTTGAYCWYNNDPELGKIYGGLYNFYVGADERGLIIGWHVPIDKEWDKLIDFLDGTLPANWARGLVAGPKVMEVGHSHWGTTQITATNASGFTALPNGGFEETSNTFFFAELGISSNFWSSTSMGVSAFAPLISKNLCVLQGGYCSKARGFGIRLMKN